MKTDKATIRRGVQRSSGGFRFAYWRYDVPRTGLAGAASSWDLALDRVCESLREHRLREFEQVVENARRDVYAATGIDINAVEAS